MDEKVPILLDTGCGLCLKYRGRFFYSSRSPIESIEKRVTALHLETDCLYLLPSPALGYGLVSLSKKIPDSSHVLCLEIDDSLWSIFQKHNPLDAESDLLSWSLGRSEELLIKKLQALKGWPFRRVKRIDLSGGSSLFRDDYGKWQGFLEKEIQTFWKNRMTLIHMGPLWIKNLLYNLPLLEKASDCSRLVTKKPVVVMGAGPSLDHTIEAVKQVRSKVFILAVDTAVPVLMARSIHPDAILLLEAQAANLQDFIPRGIPDIPFLADLTSYHPLLRKHRGPLHFFISNFAPLKILKRLKAVALLPPVIPALGSVGVAALYMARFITTRAVYYTGLDLAFTEGRSHAKGAPHDLLFHYRAMRLQNYSTMLYKAVQARPLIRKEHPSKKELLSDLILMSYADQAKAIIARQAGFFFLSDHGLSLGAQPGSVNHLIEHGVSHDYGQIFFETDDLNQWDAENIKTFLKQEQNLLQRALKIAMAVVDNSVDQLMPADMELLGQLDYIYKCFPDKADFQAQNRPFFLRLAVAIQHYSDLCERLLTHNYN